MRVKLCARCPYAPRDLAGHYDPELSAPPTGLASQARSPNHAQAAKEATYESQALRAVPLCTARLGRPLRSRTIGATDRISLTSAEPKPRPGGEGGDI